MITLNLLDAKRKNSYSLRRILLTLQSGIEMIFFSALLVGIIFSISQYYLQKNFEEVVSQNSLINRNIDNFHQEILNINYQLKEIDKIQNEYTIWSPFLLDIVKSASAEVRFHTFKIDKESLTAQITGMAKNRDALLNLKNNLEGLYMIDKVNSPISNLFKKENINFELNLIINSERLAYD